ncbi:MAG: hypothetical protein K2P81_06450 [Bacteriovoracaceae bacterium]|nr:hypothetical protein [Bacteriovoracaceae bacterium]
MKLGLGIILNSLFISSVWASPIQMINAIGASPKGQYVAIEEYGYNAGLKTYYSRIKLLNVWKNEYAAPVVELEKGAQRPTDLNKIREKVKKLAAENLEKFNIVLSS